MSWLDQKHTELDAKTLTLPLALEKEHPPQLYSFVVGGCFAFLAAFIIWASITSISEVTHAKGQIQPVEKVKYVQHLNGGRIEELFVNVGDRVSAGQVLLRLSPTATQSNRDQLEIRMAALSMSLASIDAQQRGLQNPDFGKAGEKYPAIARTQMDAFMFERTRIMQEQAKLASQVARRELEHQAAIAEQKSVEKRLAITQERYDGIKSLVEQGFAPRRDLLSAEADLEDAKARLMSLKATIATAAELSAEAQLQLSEQQSSIQSQLAKQETTGLSELTEMEADMLKFQELVDQLEVTSPIDGVIHQLAYNTVGSIARSGEIIASIVPDDGNLIADVKVRPKDIGHINVGADARIAVSTYDPFVFGHLNGKVKAISPTTFDEGGTHFFKVQVALEQNFLTNKGIKYPVNAGMEVTADVLTGEKSLARYLLKPVFRSVDQAFSER
ncbi:HlyD family type I secretion periplasmic adaptor subunit [uncultured Maritalea sp.]|uniref:HlyD family type I secretion periplasmic adaptor subunit n=1 Tax=uncultured Maritalea sp. TaxID=757249 RepID=UPI00260EFAFC|nr:HlyD family type I secretion periplasmic adaptor subunit [uncultured Maritalea sp.]